MYTKRTPNFCPFFPFFHLPLLPFQSNLPDADADADASLYRSGIKHRGIHIRHVISYLWTSGRIIRKGGRKKKKGMLPNKTSRRHTRFIRDTPLVLTLTLATVLTPTFAFVVISKSRHTLPLPIIAVQPPLTLW